MPTTHNSEPYPLPNVVHTGRAFGCREIQRRKRDTFVAICYDMTTQTETELSITENQAIRIWQWAKGTSHIQDLLPDLSPGDRELLLSGIGETAFDTMFATHDEREEHES